MVRKTQRIGSLSSALLTRKQRVRTMRSMMDKQHDIKSFHSDFKYFLRRLRVTGRAEAIEITNADDEAEPSTLRNVPKKRRHVSIALSERLNNVCHTQMKITNHQTNDPMTVSVADELGQHISSSCRFLARVILRTFIIVRI